MNHRKDKTKSSKKSSNEIRKQFLEYFKSQQHEIVASSSLVPVNDPTLLFTNAGMVQFKEVFLGIEKRPYKRATSSQRCVRAGGKHNDLERVGFTARHHTFFEMLGNFSFGDYFKREAIQFAWDFLTKVLSIPKEKLWVTVFEEDKEAEDIWLNELKIDPTRFSRCGEEDNFWAMGATGPCGPCTEIFYDHGASVPGGPPGSSDADGDRYVEIWNLVFMQYNRATDGTLTPLPKPSVDTGMGLERITAVMQGVQNNYDTDLFVPLIEAADALIPPHFKGANSQETIFSLRVIADHIRSSAFLIADGITPTNEGRGYVLRRIIRRALRHGNKLGITPPFFYKLCDPLIKIMGEAYPNLRESRDKIKNALKQEEEQFNTTLSQGLKIFDEVVSQLKTEFIPGEVAFKLYDTYGFPVDLTADIARERGLLVDHDGFEIEMSKQRDRSKSQSQFTQDYGVMVGDEHHTEFLRHEDEMEVTNSKIIAIYKEGKFVNELKQGEKASIVLDKTPFYAEAGGQVGDQGILKTEKAYFKVADTIKQGNAYLHLGKLEKGNISLNETVIAKIDEVRRAATVLNHTATHLLHKVLRDILGESAYQKGSLVEPERLRFDFAYAMPLTPEQLKAIEQAVNAAIRKNYHAEVKTTSKEEALQLGAIALFGEKYGNDVRVVQFGPSVELCGGTHAHATGDIGFFKITSESGIAAGVRRIEAVTGEAALSYIERKEREYLEKIKDTQNKVQTLEKEIKALKDEFALFATRELVNNAKNIGNIKVLASVVNNLDGKALKVAIDQLKNQLSPCVIVLAAVKAERVSIVAYVSPNLVDKMNAKNLVNAVAAKVGGKGGGRAELAEAGGNKPEFIDDALNDVYGWVLERMTS